MRRAGPLAARRIDVVAGDQHRPEEARVVAADPGEVHDEELAAVHEGARPDRGDALTGRATVRANRIEASIFDLIRRSLITPNAVRQMVEILNGDIELRASRQSGERDQAAKLVHSLERQDANLRGAIRTASPLAAGRISVELDAVAVELREATRRVEAMQVEVRPYRITRKLVQELIDQMTGLVEHAPLETRVARVRDLFERIDVDGAEQRAVACWKAPTDQGVDRLESVTEWLRR